MTGRHDFTDRLVAELTPVQRVSLTRSAGLWLLAVCGALLAYLFATGSPRPGLSAQFGVPRFTIEVALGLATVGVALWVGLLASVPGRLRVQPALGIVVSLVAAWSALVAFGLVSPALEASMVGKRAHCVFETIALGAPALSLALVFAARLAPIEPARTGAMLGAAAGAVPALLMQLFCMYEPWHGLTHHLAPIVLVVALGAAAGRWFLPRIQP